ncbi:MAG: hypothetical protein M1819_001099 [Sarea resinae]|nr:MAG: hypothetical protein M1819_001099 [Sarea resinae]
MRPARPGEESEEFFQSRVPKQHRANVAKRLSGRASVEAISPMLHALANQSTSSIPKADWDQSEEDDTDRTNKSRQSYSGFLTQVAEWLEGEKAHRAARKTRRKQRAAESKMEGAGSQKIASTEETVPQDTAPRSPSESSDEDDALRKLEKILEQNMSLNHEKRTRPPPGNKGASYHHHRRPSIRHLQRPSTAASSDNEYQDGDLLVPSCEAVLDNSKTLAYSGGSESDVSLPNTGKRATKEREAWNTFKNEILRLAHTLRLKGWRRVPLNRGSEIDVERLSGALTNAVYVVSPPRNLPLPPSDTTDSNGIAKPVKPPPKLLLRIYGPQVEHLIDRESELQILERLAKKKIGPRLLGTFTNGRFEEFFHAKTLTPEDLRVPETSKQIAKRMRELHDGIELLEEERDAGAFVWRNWDKWVERCGQITSYIDKQTLSGEKGWENRAFVCGVEWPLFCRAVGRYRKWLDDQYGGPAGVRQQLVFAHNDTQYGNILRLEPSGESPLLLPANKHKQLIVIDFEYASANLPALEFANHFTEWCYNYHDASTPHALNTSAYPSLEEQRRFLRAYIQHRPHYHPRTPLMTPTAGPSSTISSFMLDSRGPSTSQLQLLDEEERAAELVTEKEVERLVEELRWWRAANSAQWVAWGIMQAKLPGMANEEEGDKSAVKSNDDNDTTPSLAPVPVPGSDPLSPETKAALADLDAKRPEASPTATAVDPTSATTAAPQDEDEDEFDYLAYAHERAMFFWGDVLALGVIGADELPEAVRAEVKVVER